MVQAPRNQAGRTLNKCKVELRLQRSHTWTSVKRYLLPSYYQHHRHSFLHTCREFLNLFVASKDGTVDPCEQLMSA